MLFIIVFNRIKIIIQKYSCAQNFETKGNNNKGILLK